MRASAWKGSPRAGVRRARPSALFLHSGFTRSRVASPSSSRCPRRPPAWRAVARQDQQKGRGWDLLSAGVGTRGPGRAERWPATRTTMRVPENDQAIAPVMVAGVPRTALRLSGDGDQDFLGAVNGSCAAAFALVLLGVGFAALGFGAARETKAGIVEAGELALHGFGDAFGGDRGVNVREVISAQLRARLRWRDGGHGTGSPRTSDRANPARRSLSATGFTRSRLCSPSARLQV